MVKTIGNPGSWLGRVLGQGAHYVSEGAHEVSGSDQRPITVREITSTDIRQALRRGWDDFIAFRTDVLFICVIYPVAGLVLAFFAFDRSLLPLLVPLMTGFALVGPAAASGLYELSRRREKGQPASWANAFSFLESPAMVPVAVMSLYLVGIFMAWMLAAWAVYSLTLGPEPPASIGAFAREVLTTGAGWTMIVLGFGVGFLFASVVLVVSIVTFPLLLDRHVGLSRAIRASIEVSRRNPASVALWGLVVAVSLALGFVTLFVGLIFALPVLGHATWHLYRAAVVPADQPGGTTA